ncbi:MAG: hypothetical protein F6J95_001645 [Leptolyngbya sp. SIO1E4]|nr:hypothetical protein [Leptolyngbya sp. SIO1E4]
MFIVGSPKHLATHTLEASPLQGKTDEDPMNLLRVWLTVLLGVEFSILS